MKNLIFGASGATGHNLVSQALSLKHLVSTFLRSPSRLRFRDDNIRIIEGDVSDYINRAGKNLSARKKSVLEKAKNKLRQLFGSKHPSYPVPYAKDFEERELYRDTYDNYNDPSYYPIKRREFGHGQSGNMNPGLIENYGETSFRGFHNPSNVGRDYESNIGYRENYNKLDSRPGPGYEYEFAQLRRQQIWISTGKGPSFLQKN